MTTRGLARILIILAAALAFRPILDNGFVDWDDAWYLLRNPHFKGWTLDNLKWMFSLWPDGGHFCPLTWLTYAVDWSLWGMNPRGYHLTSLLLHAAAALAFHAAALRLLAKAGAPRPEAAALFAALFFAVHPLRVESVAWASERRDVLSGLFYMLTILFYAERRPRAAWACFAACLLSKAMAMTLPAILVLLDIYPLGRLPADPRRWTGRSLRPVWAEKAAFLLPAVAIALVTFRLQADAGAVWDLEKLSSGWRMGIALHGFTFYIGKTLFPAGLLPLYPIPPDPASMLGPMALGAAGTAAITALAVLWAKRRPALLSVWAFHLISLLPVCGLVQLGSQFAADRYTYIPCLGWALLFGWAVCLLPGRRAWLAGGSWVLMLGCLAWVQCGVWRDRESLWTVTAAKDPRHFIARNMLANIRAEQGRTAEALALYDESLSIHPGYGSAHNNLGNLFVRLGREREALSHYTEALKASPGHKAIHYNWGLALEKLGRPDEAAEHYRRELTIDPGHAESRQALERIFAPRGRVVR
jgi:tetratricopeptide (TPR) repeat protein